jgi:uncharacterized protein YciI
MLSYLAVRRVRGPAWDASSPLRGQAGWAEHAAFMNALAAEGFVVLGGPLGDGAEVLLIIDADSEEIVRARLALDPWTEAGLLEVKSVEPWTVLLDSRSKP